MLDLQGQSRYFSLVASPLLLISFLCTTAYKKVKNAVDFQGKKIKSCFAESE
jgi:hypothetical protein